MFWLDFLFFVSLCSGLSWLVVAHLVRGHTNGSRGLKIAFAGLLPTLLLIVGVWVWEVIARYQYDHGPAHDGFMGPMVGLIYGLPFLLGNLSANMIIAAWRGRSR